MDGQVRAASMWMITADVGGFSYQSCIRLHGLPHKHLPTSPHTYTHTELGMIIRLCLDPIGFPPLLQRRRSLLGATRRYFSNAHVY